MKKNTKRTAKIASVALAATMVMSSAAVFAGVAAPNQQGFGNMQGAFGGNSSISRSAQMGSQSGLGQMSGFMGGMMGQIGGQSGNFGGNSSFGGQIGGMNGQFGQQMGQATYASSPSEIKTSELTDNSAEDLVADYENASTIEMSDENNSVTIKAAGTYIITGTCTDGNIKVKKGTEGVVLILKDLDLTSTTGATLSLNKGTETKVIIEGTVKLTDNESLADEDTDDFDGAVIKAKAGSKSVITGSGTLYVNGNCKNGIKVSDLDEDDVADGYTEASFVIDGATIVVTAANDGMNSGTDLTIKSGNITVSAGDDGIKADYILTIGEEGEAGPTINIKKSYEGLEGAIINIYSGNITINATDDGINAANGDLTGYTFSLNIMGGTINVSAGSDGIDSNGNVNIIGGLTTIVKSASNGGDGGLDYDGTCYIADGTLVNPYGTTMDSGMGGQMGQPGEMGGMNGQPGQNEQQGNAPSDMGGQNGQAPSGMNGGFGGRDGQQAQNGNMGGQQGQNGQAPSGNAGGQQNVAPTAPAQNGQQAQAGQQNAAPTAPAQNGQQAQAGQQNAAPTAPTQDNGTAPSAPTAPAQSDNNAAPQFGGNMGGQQMGGAPAGNMGGMNGGFGGQQMGGAPAGNMGGMNGGFGGQQMGGAPAGNMGGMNQSFGGQQGGPQMGGMDFFGIGGAK